MKLIVVNQGTKTDYNLKEFHATENNGDVEFYTEVEGGNKVHERPFTGLYDANGRKILAGDILHDVRVDRYFVVKLDEEQTYKAYPIGIRRIPYHLDLLVRTQAIAVVGEMYP